MNDESACPLVEALTPRHDAARILGSGQQAGGGHHVNIAQKQMVLNLKA